LNQGSGRKALNKTKEQHQSETGIRSKEGGKHKIEGIGIGGSKGAFCSLPRSLSQMCADECNEGKNF